MKVRTLLSVALALGLTTAAMAQQKKLSVGDQAPGLDIELWAKGSETTIESGKTYVVEFWATWCGPCKKSIPHLTALQREYGEKGLTIIGVSDEEAGLVKKFVAAQGDKMDYTVAVDRRNGTKRAWFEAAKQEGIPAAFIVDGKGKIAWIGHPLDEQFDATIKRVMSGRYDPKLEAQAAPGLNGAANARKSRNWRMADKYYDEVIALDSGVFAEVALEKFEMHLVDMNDQKGAYAFAQELIDNHFANDGEALQMLASKIATDPAIAKDKQDMDVALAAAQAARRLMEDTPEALAGVALIHFNRGEVGQAIELQKQAYFKATPKHKPEFKRQLEIYQQTEQRQANLKSKPQ